MRPPLFVVLASVALISTAYGRGAPLSLAGESVKIIDTPGEKAALEEFEVGHDLIEQRLSRELALLEGGALDPDSDPLIDALRTAVQTSLLVEIAADPVDLDPNRNVTLTVVPGALFALSDLLTRAEVDIILGRAHS